MEEKRIVIYLILGVMLLLCGIKDVISKKISICMIVLTGVLIILMIPFGYSISWINMLGGMLVGVILLIVSKLSDGQIGMGDGLVFCITGLGLGFWTNLCLLLYSLTVASMVAGYFIIFCKKGKKKTLPFVPCICFGYIGVLFI